MSSKEIVISGVGAVTPWADRACDQGKILDDDFTPELFSLQEFDPRKRVSDRKMLKAISHTDAVALVAIEDMREAMGLEATAAVDPLRSGLFVGAPSATASDNDLYMDALQKAGGDSARFGGTCMEAKPVTLLIGLPNNVLCYGSMLLDTKGPNNNYTAMGSSGFLALVNAYRRMNWGKLDRAFCGGFAAHSNQVDTRMFAAAGVAKESSSVEGRCQITDAAVFAGLETREAALAAGRKPIAAICGYGFANVGTPPFNIHESSDRYERALRQTLDRANVKIDDVGLVISGCCGVPTTDTLELSSLAKVFEACDQAPALCSPALKAGNMMEAAGLYELTLLDELYQRSTIPKAMVPKGDHLGTFAKSFSEQLDAGRPYIVVSKISLTGQASVLVLRKEKQ